MPRMILRPEWVIDGKNSPPISDHAVVVVDDIIDAVVPVAQLQSQDDDRVVDLPSTTVIPGMINNHVHLVLPGDNTPFVPWIDLQSDATLAMWAAHNANVSLRTGVTTVRDCGGRGTVVLDVRQAQADGLFQGARIISCGWTLTITGGHTRQFGGEADGCDELQRAVRKAVSLGVDYIKVMGAGGGTPGSLPQHPSFTRDELRTIVETAHSLGRRVAVHCIATESIVNAIDAGVDLIEHASFFGLDLLPHFDREIAERLAEARIPVTPTLQPNRDLAGRGPDGALWQGRQQALREIIRDLHEMGVPILAGSDAGWRATAFDTFWQELDELVECGLSPVTAIHAATGAITTSLGLDLNFGTVEAGKIADLVVVEGNPAEDISRLQHVHTVLQSGTVVTSKLPADRFQVGGN